MATVLIVDHDPDHRGVVSTYLRAHGHTVLTAGDGAEGVRLAGEHLPDLVLMDASLPVTDGWSAAAQLRRVAGAERIPVVVLTPIVLPEHRAMAAVVGCAFLLPKPTPLPEVLQMVHRAERCRSRAGAA